MSENESTEQSAGAESGQSPLVPEVIAIPRTRVLPPALLLALFLGLAVLGFVVDPTLRILWLLMGLFIAVMFAAQAFTLVLLPQTMTLTQEGIVPASGGLVRWRDISEIGTGALPGKRPVPCVGVKLGDFEPYRASIAARRRPFLKDWLRTAPVTNTPSGQPAPSDEDMVVLLPRRRTVDRPLVPVSRRRPFDLSWPKQTLPESPEETVERICEYARRVARTQA